MIRPSVRQVGTRTTVMEQSTIYLVATVFTLWAIVGYLWSKDRREKKGK